VPCSDIASRIVAATTLYRRAISTVPLEM
jgi:hypothetical protein